VTVQDFVLALLITAAAAPIIVPFVEWLLKRRSPTRRRGQ
jgi:hypothetical protein